jgi:RNA polymerase sigma factor (TIGR02999 family)
MASFTESSVARLLDGIGHGDRAALDRLFALVYEELRWQAHLHRGRWNGDETLGTTVLVHEAYLKLLRQGRIHAEDPAHFLAVAATAMRHILINYARDRRTQKRGGTAAAVSLAAVERIPAADAELAADGADQLLALDEALGALERTDARRARVVECRFFGGMSVEQTAVALNVSARTVKRDWAVAQAWLQRRMEAKNG